MNMVLNSPLTVLPQTREYDNKILFVFLGLMLFMVVLGLLFVNLTKSLSQKDSFNVEKIQQPKIVGEYV